MKSSTLKVFVLQLFLAAGFFSNSYSQSWIVGTPVNMYLTTLTHFGGGCYPQADFIFHIQGSQVTGVNFVAIVTSVPPNSVFITPGQDTLAIGDTILLSPGMNNVSVYFFNGSGSVNFEFRAIGVPVTAGQQHPCNAAPNWISNLLLCVEGLTNTLINNCTVSANTGISNYNVTQAQILFPVFENNYSLQILNAQETSQVTVFGLSGNYITSKRNSGETIITLSLAELKSGIYFLSITSGDRTHSYRFPVLKK